MTADQARAEFTAALIKAHRHHNAIAPCDEACVIGCAEAKAAFDAAKENA